MRPLVALLRSGDGLVRLPRRQPARRRSAARAAGARPPAVTPRALGVVVALAVLAGDQAAKLGVLARSETALDPTPIAPFLDLVLRWNRGISFSLFAQDTAAGRVVLLALTLAAIVLLGWWLASSRSALSACGLGAIIGGAIGNASRSADARRGRRLSRSARLRPAFLRVQSGRRRDQCRRRAADPRPGVRSSGRRARAGSDAARDGAT